MERTNTMYTKKNNPSLLPSCFMTPETPQEKLFGRTTPSVETSSSVFLTPPSSQEKEFSPSFHSLAVQGVPKLSFELEDADQTKSMQRSLQRSPLLPEDRIIGRLIGKDGVDLIFSLIALNCDKICRKVCDYLEDRDLCRFTAVCVTWRNVVKQDTQIRARWAAFLQECKDVYVLRGKENHHSGSLSKLRLSPFEEPARLPLTEVNCNQPKGKQPLRANAQQELDISTPLAVCRHPVSRQALIELRPCPKCTSPSSSSRTQEGHCQCQKCGLRFCSVCLRDSEQHDTSRKCAGLSVTSERSDRRLRSRKSSKDTVGSKKSKDRVRRL